MGVLRTFRDLFRRDNWSQATTARVGEMLDLCSAMFDYVNGVVVEGRPDSDPRSKVFRRDKRVNDLEREVRRSVVTHLVLESDSYDIPSALIFMNVVKDAERIGDYIKNLHDVARELMPENPDRELYRQELGDDAAAIGILLPRTTRAFTASEEDEARAVIEECRTRSRGVEERIARLARSDLPVTDAVSLVLILRFYKRIFSHLSNIATTVVMPVEAMDFFDEDGAGDID